MSDCVGVQESGGVADACYLRNLSTERKAKEITMEIFNFKYPLQAHDLPFRKVFQGRKTASQNQKNLFNERILKNFNMALDRDHVR